MNIVLRVYGAQRQLSILLALMIATASAAGGASAAESSRPWLDRVAMMVAPLPSVLDRMAPARFFTINEVLANRGSRTAASPSVELASLHVPAANNSAYAIAPRAQGNEPFGLSTFAAPEGLLWSKWRKVEADILADETTFGRCSAEPDHCPSPAALRFLALTESARRHTGRAKLDFVNHAVNSAIRYTSDLAQHGMEDVWSTPLATFKTGRGDCEDYAIAKYVALHDAGIPASDLRLMLVRDRSVREDHAVLAVRQDGQWLILDNRRAEIHEDTAVHYLAPLFALSDQGVMLFAAPYIATAQPLQGSTGQTAGSEVIPGASSVETSAGGALLPMFPYLL